MEIRSKLYRRFAALAIILVLCGTMFVPSGASASSFTNGKTDYQEVINYVKKQGVKGIPSSAQHQQKPVKRVEAAVMLSQLLGLDGKKSKDAGYKDVPSSSKKAVNGLVQAGIVGGKGHTFGSNKYLTRGEFAVWIDKAFDLKGSREISYTDVPKRHQEAVGSLLLYGIMDGVSESEFGYNKQLTLSEMLTVLYQAVKAPDYQLRVLHTNDTHANVENAPRKITAIHEERTENTNNVLLDGGDVFSGTLYFNEFKGLADLEFMNLAGYDAMTFGNHEFDLGTGPLADFVKKAKFPFVSANVDFSKDASMRGQQVNAYTSRPKDGRVYNGIVKSVNGEKVGIFGLTTAETATISSPGEDVLFKDYIKEAKASVAAFKKQGVDKIIALTHIGFDDGGGDNDQLLANAVEGIDIIVGGHSHSKLEEPVVVRKFKEPTLIVQANEYSKYLGSLDVSFDKKGKVIAYDGELIEVDAKQGDQYVYDDHPEAVAILQKYKPVIDAKKQEVVGQTTVELTGGNPAARTGETNLGNLIADGMLAKAKTINPGTEIALQNGGGVRTTLKPGAITMADVMTVLPFSNALAIMELKGSELIEALEHSVHMAPQASGGFLQVAGMKYTYDSSRQPGGRVVSVEVLENGQYTPINNTGTYYVATNIFTAKGGDGYDVFKSVYESGRVSEPGFVDWEILSDYIKSFPEQTVSPAVEGRITDVR
ncbi:MAG: 5'-nucleotidase C-terminal domain-containing protein [Bacillus sp. (in: firmicutes)]